MNIIITGAFGFVGTNLSKALKTQFENHLVAIDINEYSNNLFNEYHSWKDLEKVDWNKIDSVIHLAGKAHDTKNTSSSQDYFDINVGLTQKIFQHFLKSSATKFIFFSSVKAVADSVTEDQLTEAAVPCPKTPYGKSKLEAERYILNELEKWREGEKEKGRRGEEEKGREEDEEAKGRLGDKAIEGGRDGETERKGEYIDKKVYILRPCMIHGPGNKGNLNLLFKIQQKGLPWPLGAFENKRSFCSVDNILFVVQQLIEKDIEPGIYQVTDDEALSTNELIKLMASSQNKKAKIWRIPAKMIKAFARMGDLMHLPLNSERLKKLTESYLVSNQKIKRALGIEKMPVSAEEGLRKTFESFNK